MSSPTNPLKHPGTLSFMLIFLHQQCWQVQNNHLKWSTKNLAFSASSLTFFLGWWFFFPDPNFQLKGWPPNKKVWKHMQKGHLWITKTMCCLVFGGVKNYIIHISRVLDVVLMLWFVASLCFVSYSARRISGVWYTLIPVIPNCFNSTVHSFQPYMGCAVSLLGYVVLTFHLATTASENEFMCASGHLLEHLLATAGADFANSSRTPMRVSIIRTTFAILTPSLPSPQVFWKKATVSAFASSMAVFNLPLTSSISAIGGIMEARPAGFIFEGVRSCSK